MSTSTNIALALPAVVGAEEDTFSARLWQAGRKIWDAQLRHPFVVALGDGTLPRANFEFYIRQDARFLQELTKMFAYAVIKSSEPALMEDFGTRLLHTIQVERDLHQNFAREFGLTVADMEATELAPTNYAYTRHYLSVAAHGNLAEIITVVLPCAWIYAEVGRHFVRLGEPAADHAYRNWIATYADPGFEEVGAWLRTTLNRLVATADAATLQRLEDIFIISSRYEWMFWDMAWKMEQWPPYLES
jgi:thiaminase/transcriptional activator TenA